MINITYIDVQSKLSFPQNRLKFNPKIVLFHPHFNLFLNMKFARFQEICYPKRRVGVVHQFFQNRGFLIPLSEGMRGKSNMASRNAEPQAPRKPSPTFTRVFHPKHSHRVAKSASIHPSIPIKSPKKGSKSPLSLPFSDAFNSYL